MVDLYLDQKERRLKLRMKKTQKVQMKTTKILKAMLIVNSV